MLLPKEKKLKPRSLCAQALGRIDEATGALVPPVHSSTTFIRAPDNSYPRGYSYGRPDNPTTAHAEAVVAALEGGAKAMLFSSGMAAASTLFMALVPGDHVIAPKVMYWSFRNWLQGAASDWGLKVELVDTTDSQAVAAAVKPGETKLIWLETPANPLWSVSDISACAEIARKANARLAVDSTVATPIFSQPLALGAHIVMHSASKYLNGHSDVIAGALVTGDAEDPFWLKIRKGRHQTGPVLGSQEAGLLLRGLRTLPLRVTESSRNALFLARALEKNPQVSQVLYPGLESHPNHDLAARQMLGGFGGMLSIRVRGGEEAAIATAARVKLWKRATSLGGVESLIEHRASVEGPGTPVPTDLLRLSVGLEDREDLLADLEQALESN
jgi:cystathionine gamma-synthase